MESNIDKNIDLMQLAEMIGDDMDFIREILGEFQHELENLCDKIINGFENDDISMLKKHVHNLKGISGNVCATEIYEISIDIDRALKSNDKMLANSLLDSFVHAKRATADFLKKYLSNESK
ncbi:MAG: Hpt domain-containing protein [Planctomycetes bacterium]|nr:Hpt domain-containing protein [Planctomycetota bacterium]